MAQGVISKLIAKHNYVGDWSERAKAFDTKLLLL